MRRLQTGTACRHVARHMLLYEGEHFFVGVTFVGTHVNDHLAAVGHHVVLCAAMYHRHLHRRGS